MSTPRVRSEVGDLRAVLLHRPGPELKRLTPRNSDQLLFDAIPWVDRAQAEHDEFAELLRGRGVEVLLLRELLAEALRDPNARLEAVHDAVRETDVATEVADAVRSHLSGLDENALVHVLTAGMTFEELPASEGRSLVRRMHAPHDFAIGPLPNLLFTRDSSMWLGDRPAVTDLAMPARRRETALTALVHTHHPRFAGVPRAFDGRAAPVEGGDVLVLAPGVFAVGVGERTSPAGAETFARSLFADGLAHTVLAVPIEQTRASMHLDTVCTMVDRDAVLMYPAVRDSLRAYTLHPREGGLSVTGPAPFLPAAAEAMDIQRLRAVDTGLDPVTAEREQWEDGNNTLALAPGVLIGYERNVETNERLREAGLDVLAVRGSELGSGRGGPRCMSCPISREPLPEHPEC